MPDAGPCRLAALDERLLRVARTCGHGPRADAAVARFSRLGEHAAAWIAIGSAGALLDRRRAPAWQRALVGVGATYVLNTTVKLIVRRPRPRLAALPPLTATPTALSFPSAHASTSVAAALLYSRLAIPSAPLWAFAGCLAYSRLYLGVHYPSDVLAGSLLGTAVARAAGAWRLPAAPAL